MTYCVGLTGGIGSGKSTAAALFEERGAAVVDTDVIARELTRAGGEAIPALRAAFGAGFIGADGGLDRARMRERAFADADARKRLEDILHPMIRARARAAVATSTRPYVILVVPLLLETGAYAGLVQRVLVVDCSEAQQVARAAGRSGLSAEAVRAIMAAQLPRAVRARRRRDRQRRGPRGPAPPGRRPARPLPRSGRRDGREVVLTPLFFSAFGEYLAPGSGSRRAPTTGP